MKTLTCLSAKGGTGKTTLASNLAVVAEHHGISTVLLDLDAQGSLLAWARVRAEDTPVVAAADAKHLPSLLEAARANGADLCLIDTPPNAADKAVGAAARAAQHMLVPCRPALFDLASIGASLDVAKRANVPVTLVLNGVPPRGPFVREARNALEAQYGDMPQLLAIGQRVAFMHAARAGMAVTEWEPRGKAAAELTQLFTSLAERLGYTRKESPHVKTAANSRRRPQTGGDAKGAKRGPRGHHHHRRTL